MIYRIFYLVLIGAFLLACQQQIAANDMGSEQQKANQVKQANQAQQKTDKNMNSEEQPWQQFTVRYFGMEGGFYGLVAADGRRYLPLNLAQEYRQDGALVKVKGLIKPDVITIYQWGTPFKVLDIVLLKKGGAAHQ